jgi:hypothetical protein
VWTVALEGWPVLAFDPEEWSASAVPPPAAMTTASGSVMDGRRSMELMVLRDDEARCRFPFTFG